MQPVFDRTRAGTAILEARTLRIGFHPSARETTPVVHGIDITICRNESVALVGESGCGKSVTALSLARLLPPEPVCRISGSIRFRGEEVLQMSPARLRDYRRKQIAYVFQDPASALNPVLTIGFQLREVLEGPRSLRRQRAAEYLALAGLPDAASCLTAYPHELSGGMQQRVVIAMALARRPALLVADEPTTALDVTIQAQILKVLTKAQASLDMALLLITHNLGLVAGSADHVWVMYAGHLVETGPVASVLQAPAHPYTRGLLDVVPRLDQPKVPLKGIPGSVPIPGTLPPGCPFAPRCASATQACRQDMPAMVPASGRAAPHTVACHHPLPGEEGGVRL